MLKQFKENIWTADTDLKMFGVELGSRMTVIKLSDGSLFIHSAIKLTSELKSQIDALGTVKYVVAPNKWHHLFIGDYKAAYPNAKFFCAPGLERKRSDFKFDQVITAENNFPWNPAIEHKLVEGTPIFNEVVFFHKPSRTLVVTDLAIHVCKSDSFYTRVVLRMLGSYGHFGWSKLEKKLYVRNSKSFDQSVVNILNWDIDGILLTHGDPVSSGGKERLKQAFFS